jgi:phosphoglycolate phosphatase
MAVLLLVMTEPLFTRATVYKGNKEIIGIGRNLPHSWVAAKPDRYTRIKQAVKMRTINAIVFDLDGTLIDSAPDLRIAVNKLLAEENRRPVTLEQIKMMIGDGAAKLIERAFAATGAPSSDATLGPLTRRFLELYEPHSADLTRPYPDVPDILTRLRADGRVMGICTNKPERATRDILSQLRLDQYFSAVFGGDSLAGIRKPDPRLLAATLDALGVKPDDAIMIGDNANDVEVARRLGLPVILLAYGYSRVLARDLDADFVIENFRDLPDALDRITGLSGRE